MRRLALLFGLCAAWSAPAAAFDSQCYLDGVKCLEGPQRARGRWIGPSDEHRRIVAEAMAFAGLPEETKVPLLLEVWTDGGTVPIGGQPEPTLIPAGFALVAARAERPITVAEFSQLPDFGYSLHDWALGLETCPVDTTDAVTCHTFAGHMGTLNSNHFLPQAQEFYRYYHDLALARAAECAAMTDALGDEASRFLPFLFDCEKEALVLEAIGQHFLADAWSSGHMWHRWGSPNRADFPSLLRGMAVAATSGVIHGARALLQPESLPDVVLDVNDALCAPHPEVQWDHADLGRHDGVGDLYLTPLIEDGAYGTQADRLFSCAVAGLRAVYEATGQQHGPLGAPSGPPSQSIDPVSADCFGQRATNRAMKKGFGIDVVLPNGQQEHYAFTPALAGSVVLAGAAALDDEESAVLGAQYAVDLVALAAKLEWYALTAPDDTNMAEGDIGSLVDIAPNQAYLADPPADYVDPPLPWRLAAGAPPTDPEAALIRTFHRAHAADWCAAFASGAADLDDLKARVGVLTTAIDGLPPGDPTGAALADERAHACDLCGELVGRHVRLGSGPDDYDTAREPLCALLDPQSPVVYAAGASAEDAGARWCGCEVATCEGEYVEESLLFVEASGVDAPNEDTARAGTLTRSYTGRLGQTGTVSVSFGEGEAEFAIDVSDEPGAGFFLEGGWEDWILVTPADPTLHGRPAELFGEIRFRARATAVAEGSKPPFIVLEARIGTSQVDANGEAPGVEPVERVETVKVPLQLGVLARFNGHIRAGGNFAGRASDPSSGEIEGSLRMEWLGVTEIRVGPDPVDASWCSLSGTAW